MVKKTTLAVACVCAFAAGYGAFAAVSGFDDVPADHWAAGSIGWANSTGVMTGPGDMPGKFNPGGAVNRAQMATVASRVHGDLQAKIDALSDRVAVLEGNDVVIGPGSGDDLSSNVPAVSVANDHIMGPVDAPISVIEYSDFECPYCEALHPTSKQIVAEYDGKVNWVYRHFPLSFHEPVATMKAEASECAAEQGGNDAFWKYADGIYADEIDTEQELTDLAGSIGLDKGKFGECMDSDRFLDRIKKDMIEGTAAGISGTPGNIILNNATGETVAVPGAQPIASFRAVIDGVLE